jgi:hypothetical protein
MNTTPTSVIGERLRAGATTDDLAAFLTWVQVDRMGLSATDAASAQDAAVAESLRRWYEQEMAQAT